MRVLVIGNKGSIGKRHSENLKALGVEVIGCDMGELPNYAVDFAIIASPTETHRNWIENLDLYGVPFLCEKPVVGSSLEAHYLERLDVKVPNMVGCNLRFSESIQAAKVFVQQNEIISFHARVSDGNPARAKYREGIALQDIHEFDYISYLLGELETIEIMSHLDHRLYDAFIRTKSGVQGVIHGDSISQKYHRELTLTAKKSTLTIPITVSNDMYVNELKYFIDCIKKNKKPMNSVSDALELTKAICEEYEFSV